MSNTAGAAARRPAPINLVALPHSEAECGTLPPSTLRELTLSSWDASPTIRITAQPTLPAVGLQHRCRGRGSKPSCCKLLSFQEDSFQKFYFMFLKTDQTRYRNKCARCDSKQNYLHYRPRFDTDLTADSNLTLSLKYLNSHQAVTFPSSPSRPPSTLAQNKKASK